MVIERTGINILKIPILSILIFAVSILCTHAQDAEEPKYQRSSLAMIIFSNDMNILLKKSEPKSVEEIRSEVVKSWNAYPFPDKYNNHNIPTKDLKLYTTANFSSLAQLQQEKNMKKDANALLPKIQQYLRQQNVAHQLVRTWFSSKNGKMFNMEYIKEMGLYNVSEEDLDYNRAKKSALGMAILEDAGENLINNTFVTVTELIFVSNEPLAEAYQAAANDLLKEANKITGTTLADGISKSVYTVAASAFSIEAARVKDGYSFFFKTFLFKLRWNTEIANKFYRIWGDENAFERMNFELDYIGCQYNREKVDAGAFTKSKNRDIEIILSKALVRTLDASFVQLQYENDVFKPVVPILTTSPFITAKIGMKEGLGGGEKFAIMQKIEDPVTHKTKWQKVGTTKVDKRLVWDNRYSADGKPENVVIGRDGLPINATFFESTGNAQEGMYLKQIMTKKAKKKK